MPVTLEYQRPLFVERQRFTQPWLWVLLGVTSLILVGVCAFLWWRAPSQLFKLSMFVVTAMVITMNAFYYHAGLNVRVDADGVHVRFPPFIRRTFRADQIERCDAETYDPIGEFGGWGIRGTPSKWGWAYNVSGNRGVRVTFRNGHRLLIGSQRAEELCEAIREVIAAR